MCGIVAVVRRPSTGPAVDPAEVLGAFRSARDIISGRPSAAELCEVADLLISADAMLRGERGVVALLDSPDLASELADRTFVERIAALEESMASTEAVNAAMLRIRGRALGDHAGPPANG